MQKELVTPITQLEVGESVYFPLPCFMKNGIGKIMAVYDTYGTVVKTRMIEEGTPEYALVFFPAIQGHQMLCRDNLVRKSDGTVVCCSCHDISSGELIEYNTDACSCKYTSNLNNNTQGIIQ